MFGFFNYLIKLTVASIKLCLSLVTLLVMSLTFTLTGSESTQSVDFFPAVELDQSYSYEIGLLGFESYNSIPNVDSSNNRFYYGDAGKFIFIPEGTYEVDSIGSYLQSRLTIADPNYVISLQTNNNTLKTSLKCNFPVDLTPDDSVGKLLGLPSKKLQANQEITSEGVVDIFKVNSVLVECNIATGSYINGQAAHTIFQFFPSVAAGFKLVEEPSPVIYLPVTSHTISNITLRVIDQQGRLVNFRGERITIRLHLRKVQ